MLNKTFQYSNIYVFVKLCRGNKYFVICIKILLISLFHFYPDLLSDKYTRTFTPLDVSNRGCD